MKSVASGLLMIFILALSAAWLNEWVDQHWINQWIKGQGSLGIVYFLLFGALFTALGLSRQALAILAGYAFGFISGLFWVELASLMGCIIAFYYARYFARHRIEKKYSNQLKQMNQWIQDQAFIKVLMIRFLPVGSNLLTNLAAGLSRISALSFFSASALGYLPQNMIFSLIGSGVQLDSKLQFSLAALLFSLSAGLGLWLYKKNPESNIINA